MSVKLVKNIVTPKSINDWKDPLYLEGLLTIKRKKFKKKQRILSQPTNAHGNRG